MTSQASANTGWDSERRLLDQAVERLRGQRLSVDEEAVLRDPCWAMGQDLRLREDIRFRPTPWGRWILADAYLANDALYAHLRREGRPTMELAGALEEIEKAGGKHCVVCGADPRLVVDGGEVRLSARELTAQPLIEPPVTELERYVTHLPLHSLSAAAASEPAGQWGRRAQDQVIDTIGWIRVTVPGRKLNPRMFVARVAGHSMDDGRSGLVDGGYAVFELWPSGTKQNLCVLVRGAFTDPETGSYAIKKYVGDERDQDGRHHHVTLVSLNPDKQRFPNIELAPENDDEIAVVAKVVHALSLEDFARRPKPPARRGRRDISSPQAHQEIAKDLANHAERFFEAERGPEAGAEGPQTETWCAELVCLDAAAGGLHIEVGPLRGLRSFVKRLRVDGDGWDASLLGSNVREHAIRLPLMPSTGPWRWVAVGFEDDPDIDLSSLSLDALSNDRAHVFRVDAEGIGRLLLSQVLSPGQDYRILIPSSLVAGALQDQPIQPSGPGWHLWEVAVLRSGPPEVTDSVRQLGLAIGESMPSVNWVVVPPLEWRTNPRGEAYACFAPTPGPVAALQEFGVEVDEAATVFVNGPDGTCSQSLPAREHHLLHLSDLNPGRYVMMAMHHRTAIPMLRMPFEIVERPRSAPQASARLGLGGETFLARPGELISCSARDLSGPDAAGLLEALTVNAPPGWPVRVVWRELLDAVLLRRSADDDGCMSGGEIAAAARERVNRRPIGDVTFDFAELGRVALLHERHPEPAAIRSRLTELLSSRAATVERLAGAYADLLPIWFEPVCASLGFDVEPMPDGHVSEPPEHAAVYRLFHVERQGVRIEKQAVRLLVLVEHLSATPSAELLAWVDVACAADRLREALLSDGFRWAAHRRASRLALLLWDLNRVTNDDEHFISFLHGASEGV